MFSIHLMLLIISAASTLGAGTNDDKLDTLLAYVIRMDKEVKDIARIEELTAKQVSKLEDRVEDLAVEGKDMKNHLLAAERKLKEVSVFYIEPPR